MGTSINSGCPIALFDYGRFLWKPSMIYGTQNEGVITHMDFSRTPKWPEHLRPDVFRDVLIQVLLSRDGHDPFRASSFPWFILW